MIKVVFISSYTQHIDAYGNQSWRKYGNLHRNNDLPAFIGANGDQALVPIRQITSRRQRQRPDWNLGLLFFILFYPLLEPIALDNMKGRPQLSLCDTICNHVNVLKLADIGNNL